MKIYFLIEIALLLAACLTAIIVTIKNVKLRKKVADRDRSIIDLRDIIRWDEARECELRVRIRELELRAKKLKEDNRALYGDLRNITAPLPERREDETDAHFNQRCRQTVANKCAKYVSVSEKLISITILR